jgi:2',3'-cyclic-nucleotide 2'-phosphodiesterase (5'-nucleotidase family)
MQKLKAEPDPIVLCSAGDFYGGVDLFNEPKDHFIARVMGRMQYDAIAVGEKDLTFGLEKLVTDWEAYDLNLLSANIFWKDTEEKRRPGRRKPRRVFPAYRIVERGSVKIGFIALLDPQTKVKPRNPEEGKRVEALTYTIEDPVPIVRKLLPEVRKKCDVLVLLAHMEQRELEKALPEMGEVDVAIIGHSPASDYTEEPFLMGTVPVYKATYQGQHIGVLRMTLDPERAVADTRNTMFTLDKSYPDEETIAGMVAEFEEENRKMQKELYAKQQLAGAGDRAAQQDTYLGAGACLRCHQEDFDIYTGTKHAHAYSTLSKMYQHRDASCIGCHSTGYGQEGGFRGARLIGSPTDLVDVQCEACHGPGAEHSRDGTYAGRAVESCTQCHSKEQDPDFDFTEAWKKIAH